MRNNTTGQYLTAKELPSKVMEGVTAVKTFDDVTLDDLIAKCETDTGYEGFVVTFDNGKMIKLKLAEYCALHNLHTEDLHREDSIIYLIINDQIDDILCQLADDDERRQMILELIELVNNHLRKETKEITQLLGKYKGNNKEFAAKYIKNKYFAPCMAQVNRHNNINKIIVELANKIEYLNKVTYTKDYYENHFSDILRSISYHEVTNEDPRKVLLDQLLTLVENDVRNNELTAHIKEEIKKYTKLFIGDNDIVNLVKEKVLKDTYYLMEARSWIDNLKTKKNVQH